MTTEQLREMIAQAWASAQYPGDDNVRGDEDVHLDRIGDDFRGKHWREIPEETVRRHGGWEMGSLYFMPLPTFHFYLPAFLLAAIDDGDVQDNVTHLLTPPEPSNPEGRKALHFESRVRLLTEEQRRTIGAFLAYLAGNHRLQDREVAALLPYWRPYWHDTGGAGDKSEA